MGNKAGTPFFKAIQALAEYIVGGVLLLAPNGDLLVANRATLRLFKAENVESIRSLARRLEIVRVVDANYQPVPDEGLPAFLALSGERFSDLEQIYVDRATGQERTLLLSGSPVRDAEGQVVLALILFNDVTDRAKHRRSLEREIGAVEERFRLLLDELSELVLTRTLDGTVTHANRSVAAFTGRARESLIGRHVNDIFDFSRADVDIVDEVTRHLRAGQPLSRVITINDAEGHAHDVDYVWQLIPGADGEPEVLSVGRDVTSYISRERQLSAENQLMTTLVRATRRVFSDLDPRALVENVVRGARELVEGSAVLYAALPDGAFVAVDDVKWPPGAGAWQPVRDDRLTQALLDGAEMQVDRAERRVIVPIAGPEAAPRWVLDIRLGEPCCATFEAVLFAMELLTRNFSVAVRNATLYGELECQRASVVELNQMKSDLIAMLAHDFKGPLTAIAGYGQLLIDGDIGEPEEQRQALQTIVSAAMRLAGLARDTLALSALEENELTLQCVPIDVAEIVAEVIDPHRVEREVRFTNECDPALVHGDPERLRQVFDNLISNAIKYSPGRAPVDVLLRRDGAEAAVDVRDRGIGVPSGEVGALFARFARASNARRLGITGTGFGLFLAKQFVEKMGGRITVFSVEGHGSTFSVHLPLLESARDDGADAASRPKRVLVADDDEDVRAFVAHALRRAGYGVRAVADGAQALERLRVEHFDAAVLDMDMPGFTGDEVRARLEESGSRNGLGLVLASGLVQQVPHGWDGFVHKPFLVKDLLAAVERALTTAS